jgi:Domain of unknown function (DUF4351)
MKTMQEIDILYQAEMGRVRLEGGQDVGTDLLLRQLNHRVGPIPSDLQARVKALPIEQLGLLGEDLLDFSGLEDLVAWLKRNRA